MCGRRGSSKPRPRLAAPPTHIASPAVGDANHVDAVVSIRHKMVGVHICDQHHACNAISLLRRPCQGASGKLLGVLTPCKIERHALYAAVLCSGDKLVDGRLRHVRR